MKHFGPYYRYNVVRLDRDHRCFWLPGGCYFEVVPWDWAVCADWCWDCGGDFVVYEDPDHPGWYMLASIRDTMSTSPISGFTSIRDRSEAWYLTSPEAQAEESEVSSTP